MPRGGIAGLGSVPGRLGRHDGEEDKDKGPDDGKGEAQIEVVIGAQKSRPQDQETQPHQEIDGRDQPDDPVDTALLWVALGHGWRD